MGRAYDRAFPVPEKFAFVLGALSRKLIITSGKMAITTRPHDPGAAALMAILCAVGAVLGLALTIFLVHLDLDYSSQASAYNSAPVCASATYIGSCRYQGAAEIAGKSTDSGGLPRVRLSFPGLNGRMFDAYLDKSHADRWQGWEAGSTVDAEVWHGQVSLVDGIKTTANPDALPNAGLAPAFFFGIPTMLLVGWSVFSAVVYRRRARALARATASFGPEQRLPLTPAMMAYLGQGSREFAEGMFTRYRGPFSVILYPNGIGDNKVAVVVNGRPLRPTVAKPLESIAAPETGTVDYLPLSRTLLEVRDAAGHILWSRFEGVPASP
jgi:hypothetical protein